MTERELCLCGADNEDECECQFQIVCGAPPGWVPFERQKPMICYDPADPNIIYVDQYRLMGYIPTPLDPTK